MIKLKLLINIFFIIIFFSCEEAPLTPDEQEVVNEANDPRARITLEMSPANLELTIGVLNFDKPVAIMGFELIYDPTALELKSVAAGRFGAPVFIMEEVTDTTYASFGFTGNIVDTDDLLIVTFKDKGYEGTTIFIRNIELIDSNGDAIELTDEEFFAESICFIKEHPSNTDNSPPCGGDYCWTNKWCWHEDVYNPVP